MPKVEWENVPTNQFLEQWAHVRSGYTLLSKLVEHWLRSKTYSCTSFHPIFHILLYFHWSIAYCECPPFLNPNDQFPNRARHLISNPWNLCNTHLRNFYNFIFNIRYFFKNYNGNSTSKTQDSSLQLEISRTLPNIEWSF